jgi:hypothetical protein
MADLTHRCGEEIWRPVVGYEELYEVSNCGNVRALPRAVHRLSRAGRQIIKRYAAFDFTPSMSGSGYLRVPLSDGRTQSRDVHALVCEAFHGPRPLGFHAAHEDGDRLNNHSTNLSWKSPQANAADRLRHGTHRAGSACAQAKLSDAEVRTIRESSSSVAELARIYGMAPGPMWMVKNRKTYRDVL